eukprot:2586400-Rhodomonas_salina.8
MSQAALPGHGVTARVTVLTGSLRLIRVMTHDVIVTVAGTRARVAGSGLRGRRAAQPRHAAMIWGGS